MYFAGIEVKEIIKMRFGGLHITKDLLLTADVMNTLNGGLSKPDIRMSREKDGYILQVKVPGVDPARMQVEIKNNQLFLFHHISLRNDDLYDGIHFIPFHIGFVIIPFDVEITQIKAVYEHGSLKVIMPFNEFSNGYHKRIHIDKN
jgi:HSP20 family molecular chaperone IbpA